MPDPQEIVPLMHDVESTVRKRYSAALLKGAEKPCCTVAYDAQLLRFIPDRVLERDFGCGDPSKHVCEGETVLDLGSGSGKTCFIVSQLVGQTGRVIGVDMNDDMLTLARGAAPEVAANIGFANVEFLKGRIQDLKPIISDGSVDVVISNCVLNLVKPEDKSQLFREVYRVLKPTGRAAISDIASSEEVPRMLQNDPELWGACISGALTQERFIEEFALAGFDRIRVQRAQDPWTVVEGIEFRSITLIAFKGAGVSSAGCCSGPCG